MKVRQNAPRTCRQEFQAACSMLESAAPGASSAPRMSGVGGGGARRVVVDQAGFAGRRASSAVLTRLPLCPRQLRCPPRAVLRKTGWAFSHVVEPVVGVAAVADGDVSRHGGQGLLVETWLTRPRSPEHQHLRTVGDGDSGRLLAAVLQCVEAVVGELGDFLTRAQTPKRRTLPWAVLPVGRSRVLPDGSGGVPESTRGGDQIGNHHSAVTAGRRDQVRSSLASGSHPATSPAREPELASRPPFAAASKSTSPVASSHVRASGLHHVRRRTAGVPRSRNALDCNERRIRTSTLDPGAAAARRSVPVSRTASPSAARSRRWGGVVAQPVGHRLDGPPNGSRVGARRLAIGPVPNRCTATCGERPGLADRQVGQHRGQQAPDRS